MQVDDPSFCGRPLGRGGHRIVIYLHARARVGGSEGGNTFVHFQDQTKTLYYYCNGSRDGHMTDLSQ